MAGIRHFEHIILKVPEPEGVVAFYRDVIGMSVVGTEDGIVRLGCGMDSGFDIGIGKGENIVDHVAVRVDSIDEREKALTRAGVAFEKGQGSSEPGVRGSIAFKMPTNGLSVQLLEKTDAGDKEEDYTRPTMPKVRTRQASAPIDLDHFTLLSPTVMETVDFLCDAIGLKLSEVGNAHFQIAFMRYGYYHHDVGVIGTGSSKILHHVALTYAGIEHLKQAIDRIAQMGYSIELGPFRHIMGSNISAYLVVPGGNRIELCTEMATVGPDTPPRIWEKGKPPMSGWGPVAFPASYPEGF